MRTRSLSQALWPPGPGMCITRSGSTPSQVTNTSPNGHVPPLQTLPRDRSCTSPPIERGPPRPARNLVAAKYLTSRHPSSTLLAVTEHLRRPNLLNPIGTQRRYHLSNAHRLRSRSLSFGSLVSYHPTAKMMYCYLQTCPSLRASKLLMLALITPLSMSVASSTHLYLTEVIYATDLTQIPHRQSRTPRLP